MLIELEIQNIGGYEYAKLAFGSGKIVIHGHNGSGKSTLIRSIIFGIFGDFKLLPEIEPFELVKAGKLSGSIRVVFTNPDRTRTITITRGLEVRKNGKSIAQISAKMEVGDQTFTGVETIKREVSTLIGIDPRLFVNTVVGFQGEISAITRRKTSQEIFDRIFGIRDFRDAWTEFRPIIKDLEVERNATAEQIDQWERDLENASTIKEEFTKATGEMNELRDEILVLSHPPAGASMDSVRDGIIQLGKSMERLVQERTEIETRLQGKTEQIESINSQICPTCEMTLSPEYRRRLKGQLRKDTKGLEEKRREMMTRIELLENEKKRKEKELADVQEIHTQNRERLSSTRSKLNVYEETIIPSLQKRIDDLETLVQKISAKKVELKDLELAVKYAKLIRHSFDDVKPILRQGRVAKVERATNEIFTDLFGRELDVTISPDDYSITIQDGETTRSTRTLSGGESVNLGLALRLAIVKSIGRQDILILDEPTESMDEFRKGRLVEVFEALQIDVQIIVVTHSQLLISAGDHFIRVEKDRGVSVVQQTD